MEPFRTYSSCSSSFIVSLAKHLGQFTVHRFSAVVEALHAAAFGSVVSVADEVYDESADEGVKDECGGYPQVFHYLFPAYRSKISICHPS